MAKMIVLAKVELDISDPLVFNPDYQDKLLDPANWNDFKREFDGGDLIPADELRSWIMEINSIEEIEIVSVKKV